MSNGGAYSGVTTTALTISGATADLNGDQYEAVFSNTAGTLASHAHAALTVDYIPTTGQPVNQTVNAGQGRHLRGGQFPLQPRRHGYGAVVREHRRQLQPLVQRQSLLRGVTTTALTISGATADLNGDQYEAVFSNTAGTLTSSAATLTVDYIPTTGQPVNQTVNAGQGGHLRGGQFPLQPRRHGYGAVVREHSAALAFSPLVQRRSL